MRGLHAIFSRAFVRWLVAAAALGSIQVAQASTYPNRDGINWTQVFNVLREGNTSDVRIGGPGFGGTTSPVSSPNPVKVGGYGLTSGGAMAPGQVLLDGTGKVLLGDTGKSVLVTARAPIARSAFVRGLGLAFGNPVVALGVAVGAPLIADWLGSRGVGINPNEADYPSRPFLLARDYEFKDYEYKAADWQAHFFPTPGAAAADWAVQQETSVSHFEILSATRTNAVVRLCSYGDCGSPYSIGMIEHEIEGKVVDFLPASMDDIAPYMDAPETPELTPDLVREGVTKLGVDPFGAENPTVTVSGPSSVTGGQSVVSAETRVHPGTTTEVGPGHSGDSQPATRTTTKTETLNVTYNDSKVVYNTSTVTTTTITNNVTGDTTTTTETSEVEDDAKVEDERDFCEAHPDSIACKKIDLDTPDADVPKDTASVSYTVEDSWGSGSCPSNVYGSINGQSVLLYDWAQTCGYVSTYIRPLLLLMCALGALFIIMPGRADA